MSVRKGGQVIAEVADLSNYALNSNVVHQTGTDDNIQGTKRFKNTIYVDNSGGYYQKATNITSATATPSSTQSAYPIIVYDNSGNQFAQVKVNVNANNEIGFMIKAKDNNWKTGLFCYGTSNGIYTYAPTPGAGDNSTKIATTAMIKRIFSKNTPGHTILMTGDQGSGDITLSQSFLNFDCLMIWGAGDNNNSLSLNLFPTWMLDYLLTNTITGHVFELLIGGTNGTNYWNIKPYADGSTNILLKNYNENCIIKAIVGINF